jgi:hypothetical protein
MQFYFLQNRCCNFTVNQQKKAETPAKVQKKTKNTAKKACGQNYFPNFVSK